MNFVVIPFLSRGFYNVIVALLRFLGCHTLPIEGLLQRYAFIHSFNTVVIPFLSRGFYN